MSVCDVLQEVSGIMLLRLLVCAILGTSASVDFSFLEQGLVRARTHPSLYKICGTASGSKPVMRGSNDTTK